MTADQLTVGSLCTGYGGLDLALKAHFNTRVIWTSEIDKHASRVVKARYRAPNLGDLKLIDWGAIEAPDIITAGYPCQPFSQAGRRNGTEDERHIWPWIAEGIRHLRPRLAVMENVPGHLTKGFGEVIGTLAEMGYDATWGCVRASDAGACHRRERVFIVATDTDGRGRGPSGVGRVGREVAQRGDRAAVPPAAQDSGAHVAPDADGPGRQGHGRPVERPRELAAAAGGVEPLLPTPTAADGERRSLTYCRGNPTLIGALKLLPTPVVGDARNSRQSTAPNPRCDYDTLSDVARKQSWGEYQPAITHWENVLGRLAPHPTTDGRLNPVFVEWMMGLRLGHVTAIDLSRTQMLKILGNGVVWQQAALALTHLLPLALTPPRQRTPA